MPVKRRKSKNKPRLTPELEPKAKRLLVLMADHHEAIRGNDEAFYTDGRHAELQTPVCEVHHALNIYPWEDAEPIIRAALKI